MGEALTVTRVSNGDLTLRRGVAELMVGAFWDSLALVGGTRDDWVEWTLENLNPERVFAVAGGDGVAGALAYSPPGSRDALHVSLASCARHFGVALGLRVYRVMRREFSTPLKIEGIGLENDCYIELLAVAESLRRTGLGRGMIDSARELLPEYLTFVLEVDDTNASARSLYASAGYVEVGRYPEPWSSARAHGTMERIYMRHGHGDYERGA